MQHVTFVSAHSNVLPDLPRAAGTRSHTPPAVDDPLDQETERFYDALFARVPLQRTRLRPAVLQRRVAACVRAAGERDIRSATRRVAHDRVANDRALQAVAIGVTGFFRDPPIFSSLRQLLPSLSARRPRGVRVLSLGCSDGRELYSVAMLLDALSVEASALHGVDCRANAIRLARDGCYAASSAADVAEEFRPVLREGFDLGDRSDGHVRQTLRQRCTWAVGDAFALVPTEPFDVVLCRNLLIYLTAPAAIELWGRLRSLVAPDGLIVVGKAERPNPEAALVRLAGGVYRPRGARP